jgi:hypothetical protein
MKENSCKHVLLMFQNLWRLWKNKSWEVAHSPNTRISSLLVFFSSCLFMAYFEFSFACFLSSTHWSVYYLKFIEIKQKPNKQTKKNSTIALFPFSWVVFLFLFEVWTYNEKAKKYPIVFCCLTNKHNWWVLNLFCSKDFQNWIPFLLHNKQPSNLKLLIWKFVQQWSNFFFFDNFVTFSPKQLWIFWWKLFF